MFLNFHNFTSRVLKNSKISLVFLIRPFLIRTECVYIIGHRITNLSGKYLSQLCTYLSRKGATMYYVGNHKRGEWESENHQNMIAVFKLVNYFCNTHISTVICTLLRTKIISRQFSNQVSRFSTVEENHMKSFEKVLLSIISSNSLTNCSKQQYCHLDFPFKFFGPYYTVLKPDIGKKCYLKM